MSRPFSNHWGIWVRNHIEYQPYAPQGHLNKRVVVMKLKEKSRSHYHQEVETNSTPATKIIIFLIRSARLPCNTGLDIKFSPDCLTT